MSDPIPSDTASDSDFDEQCFTAEEDDDSIAPDEDAADEEELNSLVKESQMSLEELLASYGVSVPDSTTQVTTVGPTVSVSRSSRLRNSRQTGPHSVSPIKGDSEPKKTVSSVVRIKRNRRRSSSMSPAGNLETNSIPLCTHGDLVESDSYNAIEESRVPPFDGICPPLDTGNVVRPDLPYSYHHNTRRAVSLYKTADRQSAVHTEASSRVTNQHVVADGLQDPPSARESHSASPSLILLTSVDEEGVPRECTTVDPTKDDGEESRDSGHEETYSTRFWKHALAGGESPPSYNSEEDEDYAPSVDSGQDWRSEIRIGDAYQASVPPYVPPSLRDDVLQSWDTRRIESDCSQLWQPGKLTEPEVIRFERLFVQSITFALPSDKTVDDEEALFLLMRCNYDPDEALQRLRFRSVLPSEIPSYMDTWSEADSTAFEKGFTLYNKDFRQIRDTKLRHKTVKELVQYYYLWKKSPRHDEFIRVYRRDKRKSPHQSITDFMDCLILEQETMVADAYPCHCAQDTPAVLHRCSKEKTVRHTSVSVIESSLPGVARHNPNHRLSSADIARDSADKNTESVCLPDTASS